MNTFAYTAIRGLVFTAVLCGMLACSPSGDSSSTFSSAPQVSSVPQFENWLFGQWAEDVGAGFDLKEACLKPEFQFGRHYMYWRGDVDGDPYEELSKVDAYRLEGDLIKLHVDGATGFEPMIYKDGFMHFERQENGSVVFLQEGAARRPTSRLVKCPSSPLPYSPDVAPTPPHYDDIAPGIVQEPPAAK